MKIAGFLNPAKLSFQPAPAVPDPSIQPLFEVETHEQSHAQGATFPPLSFDISSCVRIGSLINFDFFMVKKFNS